MTDRTAQHSTVAIPIESESCWQDPEPTDLRAAFDVASVLHPTDWSDSPRVTDLFADRVETAI